MSADKELYANSRILVVDDEPKLLETYRQVLSPPERKPSALAAFAGAERQIDPATPRFQVTTASQGEDAVELVRQAVESGMGFAVAFIDVRMPPGIDGVETARRVRELDDAIYINIVTAYSDRTIEEMQEAVKHDLTYVRKPLAAEEILQLARNGCNSWQGDEVLRQRVRFLERKVEEQSMARWAAENVVASVPDGIITCTASGLVTSVNPAALALVGGTLEAHLLQPVAQLFSGENAEGVLKQVLAGMLVADVELQLNAATGQSRAVRLSAAPTPGMECGETDRVLVIRPLDT